MLLCKVKVHMMSSWLSSSVCYKDVPQSSCRLQFTMFPLLSLIIKKHPVFYLYLTLNSFYVNAVQFCFVNNKYKDVSQVQIWFSAAKCCNIWNKCPIWRPSAHYMQVYLRGPWLYYWIRDSTAALTLSYLHRLIKHISQVKEHYHLFTLVGNFCSVPLH